MKQLVNEHSSNIAIIAGERKITYDECLRRITMFARLTNNNVGAKTMIFSENREGWIYAMYGIWENKGVVVPVDATCNSHDVAYIINDCTPDSLVTSKKKYDVAVEAMKESGRELNILVIDDFERVDLNDEEPAKTFYEDEELALICYTSGTTGSPKGVMLTFANMMANVNSVSVDVPIYDEHVRAMILLPLHHVLPLMGCLFAPMYLGGGVAICPSLTAQDIMSTLQNNEIGIFIGVPRLWQMLYGGIKKKLDASFVTRFLFWLCDKVDNYKFSRVIFKAVHKKMGFVKTLVSGGAPLDKDTARGLQVLGLDLLEGYGMTEAAPMITFTRPFSLFPGSVGKAMNSVDIKLVDGELCAKGSNIMRGYYNRPEETAEVIDSDGYLHTGDLATIDEEGHVFITGRKKEIIVTPGGKNINPAEIEFKLEKYDDYIKEVAVTQHNDQLCAIMVPQDDIARDMTPEEMEELFKEKIIREYNKDAQPYKKIVSIFVYRGDLPRTRMEKIQRFKLNDIIVSGSHKAARRDDFVEPTFEEYQLIKNYILEEKKSEQVRPTDNLELDLGFDSLDKIGLQGYLEQSFGMQITADEISRFKSVQELAEHVSDYKTRIEVSQTDWKLLLKENTNTVQVPHMWWTGPVIAKLFKVFLQLYCGFTAKGLENLPEEGPYILAPNHQSFMDGLIVPSFMKKKAIDNTYYYAKSQHVRQGWKKYLAAHHNIIIMDMSSLKDSIQQLGEVLKQGKNLAIFPEGTRTKTGKVGKFKKTFAILSKELDVPVIPVVISGAFEAYPRGSKFLKRHKITIEYLPPMISAPEESYEDFAEKIRQVIIENLSK